MLIFVEHIRKLTIKFICLFQFRFSNTITISPLKGRDTLSVFLLTIYVSIEVSGINFNVSNQVIVIQIVLLFDTGLYFPSLSFKFWTKFTNASLVCFCMGFICSTNLPSYLRGNPWDPRYRPSGFKGDMLVSRLLNKGSYQISFLELSDYPSNRWMKYLSFAKSDASFLIDSKSPFWYKYTLLRSFFFGGM